MSSALLVLIAALLASPMAGAAPPPADEDGDRDGWTQDEDCNDGEARVNPGLLEDCTDGLDNDCDGYADDLDADCVSDDSGCAVVPAPGRLGLLLGLGALITRRRRPRAG